jgi:glucosamine-6-phosphate deaminase
MAGVTVHVCPSPEHIGPLAADRLVAAVQKRPGAYLGMATGSTPKVTGFWSELQRRTAEGLDLSQVTFVNPDEWIGLGSGHPEAYRSYLTTELTNHFPTKVRPSSNHNKTCAVALLPCCCNEWLTL